jgi:hypothetical protein
MSGAATLKSLETELNRLIESCELDGLAGEGITLTNDIA